MIDSHAHFFDEVLCGGEPALKRAKENGINNIILIGCSEASSLHERDFALAHQGVFYAFGVHPDDCESVDNSLIDRLIADHNNQKAVAVGEIGLDYYYGKDKKEEQKRAFAMQIELAKKLDLPFIVHSRDATKDTMDIIKAHADNYKKGFLMHCYSDSLESAQQYLKMGAYFAFGGVITFKNAKKDDIVRSIPLNRIFCETDCPYMAPVPLRGTVNEPKNVAYVYQKMAEIYGISVEELKKATRENAVRFFGKKEFGERI